MMLIMYILAALGVGLVIYAIYGVFTSSKSEAPKKQKIKNRPLPTEDSDKEQKIQRLQSQITELEIQLEESRVASVEKKSGLMPVKEKEAEFSAELKRREEWVAKAEAELAKVKAENSDLNNKFIAKENELQEEFTKNVNLTREIRELKVTLEAKEMACRLKEDQLQAQKHQIESQLKSSNDYLATIAEFKRKEKISEWVPKLEFNKLNEEYTKLEKDLEASQERLKNFAAEIAHLRQAQEVRSPEEVKPEKVREENKEEPQNESPKETKNTLQKGSQEEIKPVEVIKEETREENKGVPQNKPQEEVKGEVQVAPQEAIKQDSLLQEQGKEEVIPKEVNPEEVKSEEAKATGADAEKETKETGEQK